MPARQEQQSRLAVDNIRKDFEYLCGEGWERRCPVAINCRTNPERKSKSDAFREEAGKHWDELPERLRREITEWFGHTELSDGTHLVGIIPTDDDE